MRPWQPEFEVSPELATRLIADQFPSLAGQRAEHLGTGWDNVAYLVGDEFVFRFPQRQMGVDLMEREVKILPLVAPRLPLPVSVPIYVGKPTAEYPHVFAGYVGIPGKTACHFALTDELRSQNAQALGRFLAALHGIPVDDEMAAWAPKDDLGRSDPDRRLALVRERLTHMPNFDGRQALELMEQLSAVPPWSEPPVWVHGDLYARHVIVDRDGGVGGVIDWGDAHLGDPALDLSIAFSFLPPEARPAFRAAYGPIDEATWDRARFRALFYGIVLTHYADEVGDEAMRSVAHAALTYGVR